MRFLRTLCLVVPMLLVVVDAGAQNGKRGMQDRMMFLDYGDRFFAESFIVPVPTSDSGMVVVMFRMANDFLTFTKNTDRGSMGGDFKAPMNVSVELRDSMGVIRSRISWKDTAFTSTFEETNSKTDFHYGWATIPVTPGSYTVALEMMAAKESQQKKIKLPAISWTPGNVTRQLTPAIFGHVVDGEKTAIRPFVFSGNISFGPKDVEAFMLVSDDQPTDYDYTIVQLPYDSRDIKWWMVPDVTGSVRSRPGTSLQLGAASTNDVPQIEGVPLSDHSKAALLEIPIRLSRMVPGKYRMALARRGSSDTIHVNFSVLWELMPLSLRTIDYGIKILKYIATDEQLDSIDSGSDPERRANLMAWWRTRDQSGATSYNERMAEYYKRVDQAFYAFSTIQEPDGAMSDRGKIYILYGPTSNVSRKVSKSNNQQEIWTYTNAVKKVFTFEVDDKNMMKLKAVGDVK